MKITKRQLKRIIKEEKRKILSENAPVSRRQARRDFEFAADELIAAYAREGESDPSAVYRELVDILDNLMADIDLGGEIDSSRW